MAKMKKLAVCALLLGSVFTIGTALAAGNKTIVTVVKLAGETWFTRMDEGVKDYGVKTPGVTTSEIGPGKADAAQQERLIEDLIARGVDGIAVVPFDPPMLEGVLKRAMDRGIKVMTHEADNLKNTQVDMEAFDNAAFGAHFNDQIADCMGKTGTWTSFVGSLGSLTHVQWADASAANAAKKYPDMKLVSAKNESFNDANTAYNKAKELLKKYPELKGIEGGSAVDVIGIGRAIEEAGLVGKVCVYGIGMPKDTSRYLKSGAVNGISLWDPKDAGFVMNKIAHMLVDGTEFKEGMDLGVPGYTNMHVKKGPGKGIIVTGQAWIDVNKDNLDKYNF
ncbi:MAG: substrate-binding domain-containing protein [Ancalomicrobiaceae bacterium]|nr:substrate-binding domain-containing protein [Ancalomicrobiaceae bacterium]